MSLSLEQLAFIGAILFFVGSSISLYIAYQRFKNPSGSTAVLPGNVFVG